MISILCLSQEIFFGTKDAFVFEDFIDLTLRKGNRRCRYTVKTNVKDAFMYLIDMGV